MRPPRGTTIPPIEQCRHQSPHHFIIEQRWAKEKRLLVQPQKEGPCAPFPPWLACSHHLFPMTAKPVSIETLPTATLPTAQSFLDQKAPSAVCPLFTIGMGFLLLGGPLQSLSSLRTSVCTVRAPRPTPLSLSFTVTRTDQCAFIPRVLQRRDCLLSLHTCRA